MGKFSLGPNARSQLSSMALTWKQGEHVLITGGTGSGKTMLARYLDQIRIDRGGFVVVFVSKLQPDDTILEHYRGWQRWKVWKKPGPHDNKILLWPAVEGLAYDDAVKLMREVFTQALQEISKVGKWTLHFDEGLMMSDPKIINLGTEIGMMTSLMRSAKGTIIVIAQRPANLSLSIYSNLSYAFIAYARENSDLIRLANLDGKVTSKELSKIIQSNARYDFTFIDAVGNRPPQRFNLSR